MVLFKADALLAASCDGVGENGKEWTRLTPIAVRLNYNIDVYHDNLSVAQGFSPGLNELNGH